MNVAVLLVTYLTVHMYPVYIIIQIYFGIIVIKKHLSMLYATADASSCLRVYRQC